MEINISRTWWAKSRVRAWESTWEIRQGKVKTVAQLLTELEKFVPTDKEFQSSFATRRITNGKLARYYLHALERAADGETQPELIPNQDAEEVNLEHILPKNPKASDWLAFDQDEHKIWVHRLGNMVLLQKGTNDRIGNKPWSEKQLLLKKSKLNLTLKAAAHATWGKEEIDNAQEHMATLAVKAWPRLP